MSSPRATATLLSHVQRGHMPALAADAPRSGSRTQRPRPVLDEVVFDVPLDLIVADSPIQTREPFDPEASDEDAALLDVVRQGLWTPPVVLRATDDRAGDQTTTYQIEDGHRRVAAHRSAERSAVRAVITRHDVREADLTTLRANTFKRLPPVQQAQAIARIRERHQLAFKSIAEMAGLTPRYVSELMRMLDAGNEVVDAVSSGRVSVRVAARHGREAGAAKRLSAEPSEFAGAQSEEANDDVGHEESRDSVEQGLARVDGKSPGTTIGDGYLQNVLMVTGWLSAEKAVPLLAQAQSRGIRRIEQLAALLLAAVDSGLSSADVLELASDMARGRVGRDIIRLLEVVLRLHSAISARRTSARDRAMIERGIALLATATTAGPSPAE